MKARSLAHSDTGSVLICPCFKFPVSNNQSSIINTWIDLFLSAVVRLDKHCRASHIPVDPFYFCDIDQTSDHLRKTMVIVFFIFPILPFYRWNNETRKNMEADRQWLRYRHTNTPVAQTEEQGASNFKAMGLIPSEGMK